MATQLNGGDSFPSISLTLVTGGGSLMLPDGIATPYQIVLFYRGHW